MIKHYSDLNGKELEDGKIAKISVNLSKSKLAEGCYIESSQDVEIGFDELPKEIQELFDA